MELKKQGSVYIVPSRTKGKFYEVDPNAGTCTCPHYLFRMRKSGGVCKHIRLVKEHLAEDISSVRDAVLSAIKAEGSADSVEMIERYGETVIEQLKSEGDVFEVKGQLKILE